jgi:hypothetical protein
MIAASGLPVLIGWVKAQQGDSCHCAMDIRAATPGHTLCVDLWLKGKASLEGETEVR